MTHPEPWVVVSRHWSKDQTAALLRELLADDLLSWAEVEQDMLLGELLYGRPEQADEWLTALFVTRALRQLDDAVTRLPVQPAPEWGL